jgi:hypothetical protein
MDERLAAPSHALSLRERILLGFRGSKTPMTLRTILAALLGAGIGLAYQRFVGCRTGTCPITSNPYVSTIYGAVLGVLMSGGLR